MPLYPAYKIWRCLPDSLSNANRRQHLRQAPVPAPWHGNRSEIRVGRYWLKHSISGPQKSSSAIRETQLSHKPQSRSSRPNQLRHYVWRTLSNLQESTSDSVSSIATGKFCAMTQLYEAMDFVCSPQKHLSHRFSRGAQMRASATDPAGKSRANLHHVHFAFQLEFGHTYTKRISVSFSPLSLLSPSIGFQVSL